MKIYKSLNEDFNQLNFKVLGNGLFHGDKTWAYNDVVSSFNRMYIVISGKAYVENEGGRYDLEEGKIYLIPTESKNNYQCCSEIYKFYLHFQIELLPGIDLFQGLEDVLSINYTKELLDEILTYAESETVSGLLHLKSIFTEVCAAFYEEALKGHGFIEKQKGFFRQKTVLQYVSKHLTSRLRISDIAAAFQIPCYQLTREFKRDTGIGLKEYIEGQLLMRGKYLLLHSAMSISEIAEELEFCDVYYFSRFFRKYEMESPREYRKNKAIIKG